MRETRRDFLKLGAVTLCPLSARASDPAGPLVNDIHSQLNATRVAEIVRPESVEDLRFATSRARHAGLSVSVSGSRHSMGGQQFASGGICIDMRSMNRVIHLDPETQTVQVEGGIQWPELIQGIAGLQGGAAAPLGIIQKQTGADWLTLGGALSSNVHGRGLRLKPLIDNIESFELLGPDGEVRMCDRQRNRELFSLAIGGYGLFGVFTSVRLRLAPRRKVQRVVEIRHVSDIPDAFAQRIRDGFVYGDFQFATDANRSSFLERGVFSCYRPVDPATPLTELPLRFHPEDWERLTLYSHTHKKLAFAAYTKRYLETSGQIYWADSQLSGAYVPNYHERLDVKMHSRVKASEMINEIYVPRPALVAFMGEAARLLRDRKANVIYGTVRLIERDDESFLRWAKEDSACIIFNLHVIHDPAGVAGAAAAFRELIDLGIRFGGSYYLTYHRFATRKQLEACYPQFNEFLAHKDKYDPTRLFQSDWFRHYAAS